MRHAIIAALCLSFVSLASGQTTEIVFTHNEDGTWSDAPDVGQVWLPYETEGDPHGAWVNFPIVPVTSTPQSDDYVFATDGVDWTADQAVPQIRMCLDMSGQGFGLLCGPWWAPANRPPEGAPDGIVVPASPTGETLTPVVRPVR